MAKKLAFINTFEKKPTFTLQKFREETKNLGAKLVEIDPEKAQITLQSSGAALLYKGKPVPFCDAVYRKTIHSLSAALIERFFQNQGAKGLNPSNRPIFPKKIQQYQQLSFKKIPIAKTFFVSNPNQLEKCLDFFNHHFPLVVKAGEQTTHGIGTMIVESEDSFRSLLDYLFHQPELPPILVQGYIKESRGRDVRAIVLKDKVLAAVERDNRKKDFRSNVFLGAKVKNINLSRQQREVAVAAVSTLHLNFGGVDLLFGKSGPLVTEVNSPCDYSFVEEKTGVKITRHIIKFLLS